MRLLWRYERFLFRRFWDAGKHGNYSEFRWQLLVAFIPLVVVLAVDSIFPLPDTARQYAAIVAGAVMLGWVVLIFRVNWRVMWKHVDAEPVIENGDG